MPALLDEIVARFHRRHEELYTYAMPDQEVVLVNARVTVVGALPTTAEERLAPGGRGAEAQRRRRIYLDGWQEVPVLDMERLAPGQQVEGAAIIEAETTTVLLGPRDRARVNEFGWLDIAVAARGAA